MNQHRITMLKNGTLSAFLRGTARSYSLIFFSENYLFAIPLIIVSFLDISAGFCGLLAVLTANLVASVLKFDKYTTLKGFYGFNSLLVGLGLGYHFELTLVIAVMAIFAGFLTLLFTLLFQGVVGKYHLPYLSLPFVFCFWIVFSAGGMASGTVDNHSGVYILNQLFSIGGNPLVNLHQWWGQNVTSNFLNSYFLSLGAIFFQFNIFAGIVIAVALLFYSRIAFLLSILGYSVAFGAYTFLGTNMTELGYSLIGFNFILAAIAIGGYFYVPSRQSFFWAVAVTPIVALATAGLFGLLKPINLTLLSLPFSFIVITFLYAFRFRTVHGNFKEVVIQEGTPERNLYSYQSFSKRFPNYGWLNIKLPFYGEWQISQGHHGDQTHKGEWAEAWDFIITDSSGCQYRLDGNDKKDYFCFGQNVIAPADGVVVVVEDNIADNAIGEVNTLKNWGNTIVIKHVEGLYSKVSHLQEKSLTVKVGDYIHYGQVIGKVGNSGRSPYPHLHFQLQTTPYIGSKTLKYPLFAYLENGKEIKTFSYPEKDQKVKPIEESPLLNKVFSLMHGTVLNWQVQTTKGTREDKWEVLTNIYNKSYLYCRSTQSTAYFQNDGVYFYFTHFEGDQKSLLYAFYQAAFRLPLVNVKGYVSTDSLPINQTFKGARLFLHDFTAPFFFYLKATVEVMMESKGSAFDLDKVTYTSRLTGRSFNRHVWERGFVLEVINDNRLILNDKNNDTIAICDTF